MMQFIREMFQFSLDFHGHLTISLLSVLDCKHTTTTIHTGDYVVTEQITEGHKVQAEIVHILYHEQIKELREQNLW